MLKAFGAISFRIFGIGSALNRGAHAPAVNILCPAGALTRTASNESNA
jgi:hypothetical protein